MKVDPYQSTWSIMRSRIAQLAHGFELNPEATSIRYDQLFFASARNVQFVLDKGARESANSF
jgi:hypothetical protein